MPPKTRTKVLSFNLDNVDINELSNDGKIIVGILSDKFSDKIDELRKSFEDTIAERDKSYLKLQKDHERLKKDFARITDRLDDIETKERKFDLVISGKNVPVAQPSEDCKVLADTLITKNLKIRLPPGTISNGTRLGKKPETGPDKRNILVTLSSVDCVQDVILNAKKSRPAELYFNENLTPRKHKIFQVLRRAKSRFRNIISGCGTRYGRVSVWIKPPMPDSPGAKDIKINISNADQLRNFCTTYLQVELENLIENISFLD